MYNLQQISSLRSNGVATQARYCDSETFELSKDKSHGFTLLEIIIALFVFAIVGTLATIGLRTVIATHEKVKTIQQQFQQLELTMTLLDHDLSQMINRPVTDEYGHDEAALVGNNTAITFTQAGYVNPMNAFQRSNLQRVRYVLDGSNLTRVTWAALDRPPYTASYKKNLLPDVSQFQLSYIGTDHQPVQNWPPQQLSNVQPEPMPLEIMVQFTVKNLGNVTRIFPIAGGQWR